jgi:hypothetical protein
VHGRFTPIDVLAMKFIQSFTVNREWIATCNTLHPEDERAMSFGLYMLGYALLIIGVSYGAHMAKVPTHWIAVLVIAMLGIGIMSGVSRTRTRDPQ